MGLSCAALVLSAAGDLFFAYRKEESSLGRLQREQALAVAQRIEQFFGEIRRQVGWTTYVQWDKGPLNQRRLDYLRLLHQVPAIAEVTQLDQAGREQLRVSRFAVDAVGSEIDLSHDPKFVEAQAHGIWFGPVYFRNQSEPYMTVALARAGHDGGVTAAAVNLEFIWDAIRSIQIAADGYAFVVDRRGRLIAHSDINLVLQDTSFADLPYIKACLGDIVDGPIAPAGASIQINNLGVRVVSAHAALPEMGWFVFVETPVSAALVPALLWSALRIFLVLLTVMAVAVLIALLLVQSVLGPIRLLQIGAERIGAGDLVSRIDVRTGDELERLAHQFNAMAERLQASYAGLERTVEARTRDLARSVAELQALSDVVRAVNSTLDLHVVLTRIVDHAITLAAADAGAIFRYDVDGDAFWLAQSNGMEAAAVERMRNLRVASSESAMGEAAETQRPVMVADLSDGPNIPVREAGLAAGYRSALILPLIGPEQVLGALVLLRRTSGEFTPSVVELMSTFAGQSALAMQNAYLFEQLAEKGRQLQLASHHKSQFLANMSHEFRTPLNAILGYTEMLADGIYGALPDRPLGVLARVQENGRNLLALINDVLDLAKIEAGLLTLRSEEYHMASLVWSVTASMEPLAQAKRLPLHGSSALDLPVGFGDARRLQQVLVNLVGNAIKFTDQGEVELKAEAADGWFKVTVRDTGPGIAAEDTEKIFEEFRQLDSSSTRSKGGSGLGLAISRHIVEMHGGHLTVASVLGHGSTFQVDIPVRTGQHERGVR